MSVHTVIIDPFNHRLIKIKTLIHAQPAPSLRKRCRSLISSAPRCPFTGFCQNTLLNKGQESCYTYQSTHGMHTVNRTSHHKKKIPTRGRASINTGQRTIGEIQRVHWESSCNVIRNPLANTEKVVQLKKGRKCCVSVKAHALLKRLSSLFKPDRSERARFQ